jgi:hypothetical protein
MKKTHLQKMVDYQKSIEKSKNKSLFIDRIKEDPMSYSEDRVIAIFNDYKKTCEEERNLHKEFMKIPLAKRNKCETLHKWLLEYGMRIAKNGGDYSGVVSHYVLFTNGCGAETVTKRGEKYSRSCQYSKTDAEHCVTFNYINAHTLKENEELVKISENDYLYLIELVPLKSGVFKATWVKNKGKQIVSESGWVAKMGDMIYHSTTSEEHCMSALKRKFKLAKTQSREATMDRIKQAEILKLTDIRRITGWCQAGCKAWLDRYMDGKISAKREEVIEAAKKSDGYYEKRLLELIA